MPLLIIPILWIATAVGRQINRLGLGRAATAPDALERCLFGAGTGLVVVAYGMLALGVCGQFRASAAAALLTVLAVAGWQEHLGIARDIARVTKRPFSLFSLVIVAVCAVFAIIALVGCFTPPYPLEWDSMSYHLSDPKIYIRHHRIIYLPWESHSNFAFTMEMLYAIGLMVKSFALAKLFHFSMAVIAALGLWQIGRRHMNPKAGAIAATLFVSIPLVFWEAGTAYVDLAAAAYAVLALLALLNAIKFDDERWLILTAVMLGCMVSIKATSIITTALYALVAAVWISTRAKGDAVASNRGAAIKCLLAVGFGALLIGSPWYVKSAVVTGNPVFPFAYSVLHGRNWDANNAQIYARDQQAFGIGHADGGQKLPLAVDILMAPWNVTMFTEPNHAPPVGSKPNPFNDIPSDLVAVTPVFLAAMLIMPLFRQRLGAAMVVVVAICVANLVLWAPMTQQERYFMPVYPLLCLIAAFTVDELLRQKRIAGFVLAGLMGVSVVHSVDVGRDNAMRLAPVAVGKVSESDFLSHAFGAYRAFEFLNAQPAGTGVVLYGEPLGLYCDQPFMWGEPTHGKAIPYESLATPDDLRNYLIRNGYRYILVNYTGAPLKPAPPGAAPTSWSEKVEALTHATPVFDNGNPDYPIRIYKLD